MQRKVFRVEQMVIDRRTPAIAQRAPFARATTVSAEVNRTAVHHDSPRDHDLHELRRELEIIYAAIDRNRQELASLHAHAGEGPRVARAANELGAAIGGMEKATQQILKAAEGIDESARTLHASLKSDYERGLAQDIQEHVVRVYEACNFQDLAGQHITKAMATLKFVEQHVARMMDIWGGLDSRERPRLAAAAPGAPTLVNGPKLEGDAGHVSQSDIDALFEGGHA